MFHKHVHYAFALAVAIGFFAPFASAAEPTDGKRWALLIGVNDYVALRPLQYSVSDMQALRDQLIACGFPREQVYLLRDRADDAARLP